MSIRNVFSALQSRRDAMFIAARTTSFFSPVGTIYFEAHQHKYAVPTELKKDRLSHIYKHSVPTKSTPNARLAFVGTKEITEIFI